MTDKPSIEAVLAHYGADRVPEGYGWRAMRCPFHDDKNASASVNTTEGAFTCHACDVRGDAIAIVRQQEDCSYRQALDFIATIDPDYTPGATSGRASGRRKTGRRWTPPGRRGRTPWA